MAVALLQVQSSNGLQRFVKKNFRLDLMSGIPCHVTGWSTLAEIDLQFPVQFPPVDVQQRLSQLVGMEF
jgi:hypothetical protein